MNKKRFQSLYFVLFPALCLVFLLSGCGAEQLAPSAESRFTRICDELLSEELSGDAISLHFALADPKRHGISPGDTLFPSYVRSDRTTHNMQLENSLLSLKQLHTAAFDPQMRLAYDVVVSSLSASLAGEEFVYLSEPFSATHGVQSEYPLLLSEYAFRSEDDVRQYLKLLEHTPDYFHSLLEFEKERREAGYALSEDNGKAAVAACDTFASNPELFIQTFRRRISRLTDAGILTDRQALDYMEQNQRLISTVLQPAFTQLGDSLLVLTEDGTSQKSLYHTGGGRDYYRYLLRENVGTDKDVGQLKRLLAGDLKENVKAIHSLLSSSDIDALIDLDDPLTELSAEEILEDLRSRMQEEFPMEDPDAYPYEVNAVDKCLEPYTAPAYYFTPPLDSTKENHIYINESQTSNGLNLYTTLAHEGFPGHLYQAVTTQRAMDEAGIPMLRSLMSYGGYVEGYATYVELYSYEYAKECAAQIFAAQKTPRTRSVSAADAPDGQSAALGEGSGGQGEDVSLLYDVLCYDRRIKLCLYCLLDVKIHGEGQSEEQIAAYLEGFGIRDETAAESIYRYIVNEPTTYLKYYVGYLELMECRALAQKNWGSAYSDAAFHTFLLKIGPAPFSVIRQELSRGVQ